jgi:hypothetical protein
MRCSPGIKPALFAQQHRMQKRVLCVSSGLIGCMLQVSGARRVCSCFACQFLYHGACALEEILVQSNAITAERHCPQFLT